MGSVADACFDFRVMSDGRILIRQWRVSGGDPSGCHLWFDPATEFPRLYSLPVGEPRVSEVSGDVDMGEQFSLLDRVGSVSADDSDEDALPF